MASTARTPKPSSAHNTFPMPSASASRPSLIILLLPEVLQRETTRATSGVLVSGQGLVGSLRVFHPTRSPGSVSECEPELRPAPRIGGVSRCARAASGVQVITTVSRPPELIRINKSLQRMGYWYTAQFMD